MITWTYWSWLICAGVLLILEMTTPATYFLWAGISAAVLGGLTWLAPDISLNWQIVLFSVLTFVSIVSWKWAARKWPTTTDQPSLNTGAARYIGQTFVLNAPIEHGEGRLKIEDKNWKVRGPDLPEGQRVKVVDVGDKLTLRVEAV